MYTNTTHYKEIMMTEKTTLYFRVKNQYGNKRYFPDCSDSKKLMSCFTNKKCMSLEEINRLASLNFFKCVYTYE